MAEDSNTISQHWQIIFTVERMFFTLHHADQHRLGYPVFVMGFPVDIEVAEPGTPEDTDLAVERLHLLVHVADVLL